MAKPCELEKMYRPLPGPFFVGEACGIDLGERLGGIIIVAQSKDTVIAVCEFLSGIEMDPAFIKRMGVGDIK